MNSPDNCFDKHRAEGYGHDFGGVSVDQLVTKAVAEKDRCDLEGTVLLIGGKVLQLVENVPCGYIRDCGAAEAEGF